jgi:hypothetical protein
VGELSQTDELSCDTQVNVQPEGFKVAQLEIKVVQLEIWHRFLLYVVRRPCGTLSTSVGGLPTMERFAGRELWNRAHPEHTFYCPSVLSPLGPFFSAALPGPPVLTRIKRVGLLHFGQLGGGGFLGTGRSRWTRRERYRTLCHRICRGRGGDIVAYRRVSKAVCLLADLLPNSAKGARTAYSRGSVSSRSRKSDFPDSSDTSIRHSGVSLS